MFNRKELYWLKRSVEGHIPEVERFVNSIKKHDANLFNAVHKNDLSELSILLNKINIKLKQIQT